MPARRLPGPGNRLVACLVCDGLSLFEFGIVAEVFALRRPELGVPWYDFAVTSYDAPPLRATGGVGVVPTHHVRILSRAGTIVIPNWRDLDETAARRRCSRRCAPRTGAAPD